MCRWGKGAKGHAGEVSTENKWQDEKVVVSVFYDFYNEIPQTQRLKTTQIYSLIVLRVAYLVSAPLAEVSRDGSCLLYTSDAADDWLVV